MSDHVTFVISVGVCMLHCKHLLVAGINIKFIVNKNTDPDTGDQEQSKSAKFPPDNLTMMILTAGGRGLMTSRSLSSKSPLNLTAHVTRTLHDVWPLVSTVIARRHRNRTDTSYILFLCVIPFLHQKAALINATIFIKVWPQVEFLGLIIRGAGP